MECGRLEAGGEVLPIMNEFVGRKMGEVLAFAETFNDTVERGREAIEKELNADEIQNLETDSQHQAEAIKRFAEDGGVAEVTATKAQATNTKLRTLRDTYIGDSWDELTEIYEWMGFYTGAAIVHWELVKGAGEGLGNQDVVKVAKDAQEFYEKLLKRAKDHLKEVGKNAQGD